jgi:hypothetical protein
MCSQVYFLSFFKGWRVQGSRQAVRFAWKFDTPKLSRAEAVLLNFYGAQKLIPRNRFRQPMQPGGPVREPYSYLVPGPPIDCSKIPGLEFLTNVWCLGIE